MQHLEHQGRICWIWSLLSKLCRIHNFLHRKSKISFATSGICSNQIAETVFVTFTASYSWKHQGSIQFLWHLQLVTVQNTKAAFATFSICCIGNTTTEFATFKIYYKGKTKLMQQISTLMFYLFNKKCVHKTRVA